jgi:hypothetical protein
MSVGLTYTTKRYVTKNKRGHYWYDDPGGWTKDIKKASLYLKRCPLKNHDPFERTYDVPVMVTIEEIE